MMLWYMFSTLWSTLAGHGIALIEPRDEIRFPAPDLEAPASSLLLQLLDLHFLVWSGHDGYPDGVRDSAHDSHRHGCLLNDIATIPLGQKVAEIVFPGRAPFAPLRVHSH